MKFLKFLGLTALILTIGLAKAEESSCLSDTNISVKEVKKALAPILGNAKVISVTDAPVEGLYEVTIEVNGKRIPVYLDCSLRYLISGEIIDVKQRKSLTREKVAKLNEQSLKEKLAKLEKVLGKEKLAKLKKAVDPRLLSRIKLVNVKQIPKKGRVIFGNLNAKYTVYIVTDPQCPFCARLHKEIEKILAKRKDVKFEMILFPLPFHKYAKPVSTAIICEKNNEKQQQLLTKAFESQSNQEEFKKLASKSCSEAESIIDKNLQFAKKVGIGGTPTLIFPPGIAVSGALPAETIEKIIDALK